MRGFLSTRTDVKRESGGESALQPLAPMAAHVARSSVSGNWAVTGPTFFIRPLWSTAITLKYGKPLNIVVMSKRRMPTYLEIRDRIYGIGADFSVSDIKQLPRDADDEQYRMAFMYQLLTAGRISEVCGNYAPKGNEVYEVEFKGVQAIMFVVKTAKREGKLRAAALPLDPEYEPWTAEVFEYFKKAGDDHPFKFGKNWVSSKRLAQYVAAKTFDGFEWPMKKYSRAELRPITDFEILAERLNDRNKEVCLIELDEDTARWVPKVKDMLRVPKQVPSRWNNFRSHGLRKRREVTNKFFYKMDIFQRAAFGGWTETSRVETASGAMEHYDYLDLSDFEESYDLLYDLSDLYFEKLLRPFGEHR